MLAPNWMQQSTGGGSDHAAMNKRINEVMTKNRYKIPVICEAKEVIITACGQIDYADLVVESNMPDGSLAETILATAKPGEEIPMPDALKGVVPVMRSLEFYPGANVPMVPRLFVIIYPDEDAPNNEYPTISYYAAPDSPAE